LPTLDQNPYLSNPDIPILLALSHKQHRSAQQGLDPDHTIAEAGQGLRAGQKAAWGNSRATAMCFIQRQCEGLANTLARLAKGATSHVRGHAL